MSTGDTLKGHELFRSLKVDEAHRLSDFSSVRECEAGQTIFSCNDPGTHVYMLMKGSVQLNLCGDPEDYMIVVSKIEEGELFGLSPLLDSPRYTTGAQCTEKTQILAIEAQPFRELLNENQPVAIEVLNRVARIYFGRYLNVLKNLQGIVNQIPLMR